MYVGPGGAKPQLPREALDQIGTLCAALFLPEAIQVLQSNQQSYSDGANVFSGIGHVSLENCNYERAFGAYVAAFQCAEQSGEFGLAARLEKLCDAAQLVRLLDTETCAALSTSLRRTMRVLVRQVLNDPGQILTLPLVSKLLISTGEVGLSPKIQSRLLRCIERVIPELKVNFGKAAHEAAGALSEVINGHEMVARGQRRSDPQLSARAISFYSAGINALSSIKALPELRSYLHLCLARLYEQQRESSYVNLNARFAALALEDLHATGPSLPSVVRIAMYAASRAVLFPELTSLHTELVSRFELPLHHTVGALALWSEPHAVQQRLSRANSDVAREEIIRDAKEMIRRAEFLSSDGVEEVSALNRAQLHASKAWIAERGDVDPVTMLAEAKKALLIAAREPGVMSCVADLLQNLAWNPSSNIPPGELCTLFQEILSIYPELPLPHCREAAELRCQALVGLANSLHRISAPVEVQRDTLLPAMKLFMEFLFDTDRDEYNIDVSALSVFLRRGEKILLSLPVGQDRDCCIKVLTSLYQRKSPESRHFQEPADYLEFLEDALKVEQIAIKIFSSQGKVREYMKAAEAEKHLKEQIEYWKNAPLNTDSLPEYPGPGDEE